MSKSFCVYKNKKYSFVEEGDKLKLTTFDYTNGFDTYVDSFGHKWDNCYSKVVTQNEVEAIFALNYKVVYKNISFEPFSMNKSIVKENKMILVTSDYKLAETYNFDQRDRFEYIKEISLEEIEELLIIKTPILRFSGDDISTKKLEGKAIKDYLINDFESEYY